MLSTHGRRAFRKPAKVPVKGAEGIGSANADMSSDKGGERPPRRKPKVSYATFIGVG